MKLTKLLVTLAGLSVVVFVITAISCFVLNENSSGFAWVTAAVWALNSAVQTWVADRQRAANDAIRELTGMGSGDLVEIEVTYVSASTTAIGKFVRRIG